MEKRRLPAGGVDASISGMLRGAVTSRSPQWAQKTVQAVQRARQRLTPCRRRLVISLARSLTRRRGLPSPLLPVTLALLNHAGVFGSLIGKNNLDECAGRTGGSSSALSIPAGGANDPESYKSATDSIVAYGS